MAIVGGALLLVTRKVKADKVYREIDWTLLLMFVGLFVVVTGLEMTVLAPETIAAGSRLDLETTPVLSVVTAGLSNLVSNVPAVLVLKPFIANSLDPQRAWLVVVRSTIPDPGKGRPWNREVHTLPPRCPRARFLVRAALF